MTYKAIQVYKNGGSEEMKLSSIEKPAIKDDEVLLRIEYAGINYIDVYFRQGVYKAPKFPFTPGKEGLGVVEAVGSAVKALKPGDRAGFCMGTSGSYSDYSVEKESSLVKVPAGVQSDVACAALLQGFTAHYLVNSTFAVKAGHNVLVHAAAGGVGQLLCRMLKIKGANVIGTVSTDAKKKIAENCGADNVIVYGQNCHFKEQAEAILKEDRFDVVYDSVGAPTLDQGLGLLKPRGMMALFGQSGGVVPPFDLNRLNPLGSLFITRPSLGFYILTREELDWRASEVFGMIAAGKLPIQIGGVYPLADAAKAHDDLEGRRTTGKLLLKVAD